MAGFYFLEAVGVTGLGIYVSMLTQSRLVIIAWLGALGINVASGIHTAHVPLSTPAVIFSIGSGPFTWYALFFDLLTGGSLIAWAIIERRKRLPEVACPSCGYDLAGLSPSAVCPECGERTVPNKPDPA